MLQLSLNLQQIILIVLIFIFILKKIFSKHPIVVKYDIAISIILLLGLITMIVIEFWHKKLWVGIGVAFLGLLAIMKVLMDSNKRD